MPAEQNPNRLKNLLRHLGWIHSEDPGWLSGVAKGSKDFAFGGQTASAAQKIPFRGSGADSQIPFRFLAKRNRTENRIMA
jgi:hypothetical protein